MVVSRDGRDERRRCVGDAQRCARARLCARSRVDPLRMHRSSSQSVLRSVPIDDDERLRDVERVVEDVAAPSASRAAAAAARRSRRRQRNDVERPIVASARRHRDVGRDEARVRREPVERHVPDAAARERRAPTRAARSAARLLSSVACSARYESGASVRMTDFVERNRRHANAVAAASTIAMSSCLQRAEARRERAPAPVESARCATAAIAGRPSAVLRRRGCRAQHAAARRRAITRASAIAARAASASSRRRRRSPRRLREQRHHRLGELVAPFAGHGAERNHLIVVEPERARDRVDALAALRRRAACRSSSARRSSARRSRRGSRASAGRRSSDRAARRAAARCRAAAGSCADSPRSAAATRALSLLRDARVAVARQIDEHELRR